jgi:hypothetical protein
LPGGKPSNLSRPGLRTGFLGGNPPPEMRPRAFSASTFFIRRAAAALIPSHMDRHWFQVDSAISRCVYVSFIAVILPITGIRLPQQSDQYPGLTS